MNMTEELAQAIKTLDEIKSAVSNGNIGVMKATRKADDKKVTLLCIFVSGDEGTEVFPMAELLQEEDIINYETPEGAKFLTE